MIPRSADAAASAVPIRAFARRPPRSRLLAVVYLISLAILLIAGGGLSILASAHASSAVIGASASADRALGERLLADLGPLAVDETPGRSEVERMTVLLRGAAEEVGLLDLALLDPDGRLRASAGGGRRVRTLSSDVESGRPSAELVDGTGGPRLHEWFPAQLDGRTVAVLEVVRDGADVVAMAEAARRDIMVAAAVASSVLVVVLFVIFRGAQRRLDEQTEQLLESVRRDPLTGLLTHGAALAELTTALEAGAEPIAVALVDVDNFRQLNDQHGHALGDAVLRTVASTLEAGGPPQLAVGRSGPDEFVVVSPGTDAQALAARLEVVRYRLARPGTGADSGHALPITLSAGIAVAPLHGRSSTELLSAAAMTLGEATGGGGDRILISRLSYADLVESQRATFSILIGLVNAIDARDRYTRHHSEDVARYALFLARELGVDHEFASALHQAALLHDVGKIAVPDALLRRPGPLTADEMEVMKQHVLFGEALVRDLVSADLVIDGVRHHHERWDGAGYPDGLEADEIPLIARVIAVADGFSAMTTTRPHRRAISPPVALQRLGRAAGSQLDPRLVDLFILAMERQADPPLPSDPRAPATWLEETAA